MAQFQAGKSDGVTIRERRVADHGFHREMIYLSLWDAPDEPRRPRTVLRLPRVRAYFENWGERGDTAIVAEVQNFPIGLIQARLKESVTEDFADFPELSIALLPQYQSQGIGSRLMLELIMRIRHKQPGIRLGVHPKNKGALALYQKFGFRHFARPLGEYPQMVLEFDQASTIAS